MAETTDDIVAVAAEVLRICRQRQMRIATAESCTGGLVAAALTAVAGSSDVFERGYVTYSNAAKISDIGVPAALIALYGAVSAEVAEAMAAGTMNAAQADIAVTVTGIAGPGGGSADKPVGLVHIGLACKTGIATAKPHTSTHEYRFGDIGRTQIRQKTVLAALNHLRQAAETAL